MILHWRIRTGSDWWFKKIEDQDWNGFSFIGSELDSDWKISQSAHLCFKPCTHAQSNILQIKYADKTDY